jgi:hypothetical protein
VVTARGGLFKDVFMQVEIYPLTCERNAFHSQAKPLLSGRTPSKFDLTSRAEHALPGKLTRDRPFQKARHGPVITRVSSRGSHLAIAGNLSTWDGPNRFCKCFVTDLGSNGIHRGNRLPGELNSPILVQHLGCTGQQLRIVTGVAPGSGLGNKSS